MKHAKPPRHPTVKVVLVAFVVSIVLFGAVFSTGLWRDYRQAEDPAETDAALGRVYTVAVFFRKTVDELSGAALLTIDTRQMRITVHGFSPQTEIGDRPLQEQYRVGSLYAATQLAENCDAVLSFSVSNVAAFLVYTQERLTLTLPEQVDILPAGECTLTPIQVADVLRYEQWSTGERGRADIHAQVMAAILNRYWVDERDLEQDFKELTALCDERLHISQFEAVKDELYTVAKHNDGHIAQTESD
ncbi:MAG: hypothetical protein IJO59_05200 [Clostridia bacterium]|nr:hypothetical protein [Clostridia bacterium]